MKIRLAAHLQSDSIVDGIGIRTVIWTQGCPHNCKGCHNMSTHDFKSGIVFDIDELKEELLTIKGQDGITLSGGEPFSQPLECLELAKFAHSIDLTVWAYSGFVFEDILKSKKQLELLKEIDILVDGKFEVDLASLDLLFKGSSNQRVIDVKKSLEKNEVILVEEYSKFKDNKSLYQKKTNIFI